ncbi:hypothetical protein HMPREF1210_01125 [Paenisporosarcina sp. HGH0030]|uniref:sialidase family protein n=1 Tax=Paenisporosarcina sp. HGH0030 TaxID=1078085 RepID=UPI00034E3088|nr:sialidase family protein [Paenisporosarcina sp. HGH0030]EPD52745.1 hypothetical protein HMPREF1210_01125 [Paenisporosarcina sp. HGH0030]
MPTVLDATVVARADDTSENGGRKLVRLSNGWLINAVWQSGTGIHFYKSQNNGSTWSRLCYISLSQANAQWSLTSVGTKIHVIFTFAAATAVYTKTIEATTQTDVDISSPNITIDIAQTAFSGISIEKNEAGTELHATWASKNATYANSFNIRYAKGTIATDGSVAWGVVEQRTFDNSTSINSSNPSVVVKDGLPIITLQKVYTSGSVISCDRYTGSAWISETIIYQLSESYIQSNPSAIFVPQSINGLSNGLIADVWDGFDATHPTTKYIRFSKSFDGGVSWSAMQKLVPGINGSLTTNKSGKLFITYDDAGTTKRIESTNNGDTWGLPITVGTGTNPSSLFDLTMNMSVPLTIRKGATSVLFSGTWTVTTISVPQGSIGQKTTPSNILAYAITTDGAMSTITEKVNGVTIGTKTATSGQSLTAGLTQAQWDDVKHGKYNIVNLIGSLSAFSTLAEFNQNFTVSNLPTKNFLSKGLVELTANNASGIYVTPKSAIKELAETYFISIVDVKAKNTPAGLEMAQSYGGVSSSKKITAKTGGYSVANVGTTIPIISALKVVGTPTTGLYSSQLAYQGAAGDKLEVSGFRTYKISKAEYDGFTTGVTLSVAQDIAAKYPYVESISENTLTIEMGSEVFTYTFEKRLATDADVLSAVKATQDVQTTYIPAVKSKLGTAIRAKGGAVNDADTFEVMASAVSTLPVKQVAGGTVSLVSGVNTISGLPFKPRNVHAHSSVGVYGTGLHSRITVNGFEVAMKDVLLTNSNFPTITGFTANGFTVQAFSTGTMIWDAEE